MYVVTSTDQYSGETKIITEEKEAWDEYEKMKLKTNKQWSGSIVIAKVIHQTHYPEEGKQE